MSGKRASVDGRTAATDLELVTRYAADGDADAFAELAARHRDRVYATCRRMLASSADAEDAAQECFVHLARSATSVRTSVAGWLHRVAVRVAARSEHKEQARRDRERQAGAMAAAAAGEASWESIKPEVDRAIDRLPDRLRLPLVLYYVEGNDQAAVAAELGLSRSAVSRRISRAVEQVRKHLRELGLPLAAATLAGYLSSRMADAAPPTLAAALGKLSVAGVGVTEPTASAVGGKLGTALAALTTWQAKVVCVLAVALAGALAVHPLVRDRPPEAASVARTRAGARSLEAETAGPQGQVEEAGRAGSLDATGSSLPHAEQASREGVVQADDAAEQTDASFEEERGGARDSGHSDQREPPRAVTDGPDAELGQEPARESPPEPEPQDDSRYALVPAHTAAEQGDYTTAIAICKQVKEQYPDEPALVAGSFNLHARCLALSDDEIELETLIESLLRTHAEDRRQMGSWGEMRFWAPVAAASARGWAHRRAGRFAEAVEAQKAVLQLYEEVPLVADPPERERELRFRSVILRSRLGDLQRYAGQYGEAASVYEDALHYEEEHPRLRQDDGPAPPPVTPEHRLAELIAWCRKPQTNEAEFGFSVDTAIEIGDFHRELGERYSSQSDCDRAVEVYQTALDFLGKRGIPPEFPPERRRWYERLRDEKLPGLIHRSVEQRDAIVGGELRQR